jgi:hypothetical protein
MLTWGVGLANKEYACGEEGQYYRNTNTPKPKQNQQFIEAQKRTKF